MKFNEKKIKETKKKATSNRNNIMKKPLARAFGYQDVEQQQQKEERIVWNILKQLHSYM